MTSLLTNTSALAALSTLRSINENLAESTQRLSTGLRIGSASDNASYWSLAQKIESDSGAMGVVQDALAIGKANTDVAFNGLDSVRKDLDSLKQLLVSAKQVGVDRTAIQTQVTSVLNDISAKAAASTINGENFLQADTGAAGFNPIKSIVASFERSSAGVVSVATVDLDIRDTLLFDDDAARTGIMDQTRAGLAGGIESLNGTTISVLTDSGADMTTLDGYIAAVDAAISETITAANEVGVVQSRVASQSTFVSNLMDAKDNAAGALVDANVEAESTRLQALQTQQALAIEALSIANNTSQSILALFR